jgi:hypothetical protein
VWSICGFHGRCQLILCRVFLCVCGGGRKLLLTAVVKTKWRTFVCNLSEEQKNKRFYVSVNEKCVR